MGRIVTIISFIFFAVLYGAWLFFTLLWTPDLDYGLVKAVTDVQLVMTIFVFTLLIQTKRDIVFAYQAYVLGDLVGAGIIIYNYTHGIESPYYNRYGIKNIETDEFSQSIVKSIVTFAKENKLQTVTVKKRLFKTHDFYASANGMNCFF